MMPTIRVPATMANLGPGFDSFGMAVTLYNQFTFTLSIRDELVFAPGDADVGALTRETRKNPGNHLIWRALDALYEKAGRIRPFVRVEVKADIPVARGLGSSSTAIVAALVAGNALLDGALSQAELLDLAIALEHHPDNVAPALLGGVVLYDTAPYALPWPPEWRILALSPDYPVKTEEARRILPEAVSREDAIFNLRKASVLTYALLRQDPDALRAALDDRLHQPYRRRLIAEYDPLEQLVLANGAFGMIISGSGPTMGVFYPTVLHASLLEVVKNAIQQNHWRISLYDIALDSDGAQLI